MTYAEDDRDWSAKVFIKYSGKCVWPGCGSTFGLGGHHIIPRGLRALRLVVENGILMCTGHHDIVEKAKGTKRYDIMMSMLAGKHRYDELKELQADAMLDIVQVRGEPVDDVSSDVGW
jgi:hypothetical protein